MNNATHAVVVTKPGHGTVRLGPLPQTTVVEWRRQLESALTGTAHPAGTTITAEPYDPGTAGGYINPASIPSSVDELMEPLRADTGDDDPGARFPDLYTQLVLRHGHTRAGRMWMQACCQLDEEAEASQAAQDIEKAIAEARSGITEGLASGEQALRSVDAALAAAGRLELGIPGRVAVYPSDAPEHLAIALRELRAAGLVLQPAEKT